MSANAYDGTEDEEEENHDSQKSDFNVVKSENASAAAVSIECPILQAAFDVVGVDDAVEGIHKWTGRIH